MIKELNKYIVQEPLSIEPQKGLMCMNFYQKQQVSLINIERIKKKQNLGVDRNAILTNFIEIF